MAIHGFKVDNAAMQRALDNITAQQLRKVAKAGEAAMKDISDNVVATFYGRTGSSHDYSSIPNSLDIRQLPARQNSRYAWVDIEMFIDEGTYLSQTEDWYSIYHWADNPSHKYPHSEAASFVIGLQWNSGIIGLPSPYAHLSSSPMSALMEDELKRIWNHRVKKFLK